MEVKVDDEDDISMAALATIGAVSLPAPMGNWTWLDSRAGDVFGERARRDSLSDLAHRRRLRRVRPAIGRRAHPCSSRARG